MRRYAADSNAPAVTKHIAVASSPPAEVSPVPFPAFPMLQVSSFSGANADKLLELVTQNK